MRFLDMKRHKQKPILTDESRMTLLILGGVAIIIIGTHVQNVYSKPQVPVLVNQSQNDFLSIPSLGIKAPIFYSQNSSTKISEVELDKGIVHINNTPVPGVVGNAFFVGGSSAAKDSPIAYNDIFKNLQNIAAGDQVIITKDLKHLTYQVYETRVIAPTELWVTSQLTDGEKIITLETDVSESQTNQKFIAIARLKN
jgi:LPXTG-site transpeptidase (sortase) family protein